MKPRNQYKCLECGVQLGEARVGARHICWDEFGQYVAKLYGNKILEQEEGIVDLCNVCTEMMDIEVVLNVGTVQYAKERNFG